jgi:hypothetical protein
MTTMGTYALAGIGQAFIVTGAHFRGAWSFLPLIDGCLMVNYAVTRAGHSSKLNQK